MVKATHEMLRAKLRAKVQKKKAERLKISDKLRAAGMGKYQASRIVGAVDLVEQQGRPTKLTPQVKEQLRGVVERLTTKHKKAVITQRMIWNNWKAPNKVGFRTFERWASSDLLYRGPREGAVIDDPAKIAQREDFREQYANKSPAWWCRTLVIDGHRVKKITTPRSLAHYGEMRRRGVYVCKNPTTGEAPPRTANETQPKA
jgi:hypothetical protein